MCHRGYVLYGKQHVMAVSSFTSASMSSPLVLVLPKKGTKIYDFIPKSRAFVSTPWATTILCFRLFRIPESLGEVDRLMYGIKKISILFWRELWCVVLSLWNVYEG